MLIIFSIDGAKTRRQGAGGWALNGFESWLFNPSKTLFSQLAAVLQKETLVLELTF